MNKLFITKSALFTITVLLMLVAWVSGINSIMTGSTIVSYLLLLVLAIITIIDFVKHHDDVNHDKNYNLLSIISFAFMLIVLIRTFLDGNIITVGLKNQIENCSGMIFLGNNLIYFNILFCSLLVYRFTFMKELKKKDKKIK